VHLKETPKWLLGQSRDSEVVENLQFIAQSANRTCSLTLEQLEACGEVKTGKAKGGKASVEEFMVHLRGLFPTRKIGLSTGLVWLSWALIGLAYPLFNVFLPTYLASRGAEFGDGSVYQTYREFRWEKQRKEHTY
jgi:hypothetical protein